MSFPIIQHFVFLNHLCDVVCVHLHPRWVDDAVAEVDLFLSRVDAFARFLDTFGVVNSSCSRCQSSVFRFGHFDRFELLLVLHHPRLIEHANVPVEGCPGVVPFLSSAPLIAADIRPESSERKIVPLPNIYLELFERVWLVGHHRRALWLSPRLFCGLYCCRHKNGCLLLRLRYVVRQDLNVAGLLLLADSLRIVLLVYFVYHSCGWLSSQQRLHVTVSVLI